MENKLISIIVPIYNVDKYLVQCLVSIMMQTYKNIEIILIDDGSTDKSGEICDLFVGMDNRFRVIHKQNEGLVKARKTGIIEAKGDYVVYVDGDDWIEKNALSVMFREIKEHNVDVVITSHYEVIENSSREIHHGIGKGVYKKEGLKKLIYPNMIAGKEFFKWYIFPSLWGKMFKKKYLKKFQLLVDDDIRIGEDAACVYPCLLNICSLSIIDDCLYYYRQNNNSMIKSKKRDNSEERNSFIKLYQTVRKQLLNSELEFNIIDCWKKFVLFLMIARADTLYTGYEKLDYLFPYSGVNRGAKIVLYCAGTYGQRLYNYLEKTHFCEVVAWVDRNYMELRKLELPVNSPDIIAKIHYDYIVVANMFEQSRIQLYEELCACYSKNKVKVFDLSLIFNEETYRALGLE